MTVSSYMKKVSATQIDSELVTKIAKAYNAKLPELVGKLVTISGAGEFVARYRFLSYSEIYYAEDDLGISLRKKKIVPIVDCGDNDFIVYNAADAVWQMYNIVDEIGFSKTKDLADLLK